MCDRAIGDKVDAPLTPGDAAMLHDNVFLRFPRIIGVHAVFALLVCACQGGDATNPPVDDVVASVAVSPGSPLLVEGDSVQLTAAPKNASGITLNGKTIAWSSSATTIATVSDKGVVTGVKTGSVTITATVEGKSGKVDLAIGKGVPLVLETARAANDSIGPAGGTITATATNGVVYTLTVPPNALFRPKRITVTPVKSIRTVPLGGAVLGAVDLQPSGLRFTKPVRLKIAAATTHGAGQQLIGFSFEAQGDSVRPEIVADSGGSATVLLTHFSGGGAAFGSQTDVRTFMSDSVLVRTLPNARFIDSLFVLSQLTPRNFDAELQVLRNWLNDEIIPEIRGAQNDSVLALAIGDYHLALETQLAFGISASSALGPEKAAAAQAIAPKLRAAIDFNNALCKQFRDIVPAANVLFWQTQAADFGVDTPAEQLDRATVLFNLCIQVVFTRSDYPDPALAHQQGTLEMRAGMQFGSQPNLALELFTWTTVVSGSTSDGTQTGSTAPSSSDGFTLQITPTGQANLEMRVKMCIFDNQLPYLDVCGNRTVTRPFGVTLTGNQFVLTQAGLEALSNVSKIDGSLTIQQGTAPITSTDLRELSQLTEVTGTVTIASIPSLQRLDGLRSLKKVGGTLSLNTLSSLADMSGLALTDLGGLAVNNVPALTAIEGVGAITSLNVSGLQLTNLSALTSIGGFSSLRSAKQLVLQNDPLLASLQSMRGVTFASELAIENMPSLTTLDDLTGLGGPSPLTVLIVRNPLLGDLSALSGLTHLRAITLDSPVITDLSFLAQLETIDPDGQLSVSGAALTSVVVPNLAHAGSVSAFIDFVPNLTTVSLPSLVDGSVQVFGSECVSGRTISVQVPELTSAANFEVGAGSTQASCSITVNAAKLANVLLSVNFSGGVTSVSLGVPLKAQAVRFSNTAMRAISLPALDVQTLVINGNQQLSSVGGSGGRVTTTLSIQVNPNLSTQEATIFANTFNPHGTIFISGNKSP